MKLLTLITILLTTTSLIPPSQAQEQPATSKNQVLNACIQNQAQTLPVPFSDVSPDHWAFKAVMTMYYCGAFRQATPPTLFDKLQPTQSQQQSPTESQPQISSQDSN